MDKEQVVAISNLKARIANPEQLLKSLGKLSQNFIGKNLDSEGENLGQKWQPLSPVYAKRKAKKGYSSKPLVLKGLLRRAATTSTPIINSTEGFVEMGLKLKYAEIHHKGGEIKRDSRSETFVRNRYKTGKKKGSFKKGTTFGQGFTFKSFTIKIPARPFFTIAKDDINELQQTAIKWLRM